MYILVAKLVEIIGSFDIWNDKKHTNKLQIHIKNGASIRKSHLYNFFSHEKNY